MCFDLAWNEGSSVRTRAPRLSAEIWVACGWVKPMASRSARSQIASFAAWHVAMYLSQPMTDHPISVPTSFPPHPASSRLVPPRSDKNPQRNLDLLHRDDSLALNYNAPCR